MKDDFDLSKIEIPKITPEIIARVAAMDPRIIAETRDALLLTDTTPSSTSYRLKTIRAKYQEFETPENRRRIQALESIFNELEREGYQIAAFFGGSLVAGQSIASSDIEIQLVAGDQSDQTAVKGLLAERIKKKLGEAVKVDYWGTFVDLSEVDKALNEVTTTGTGKLSAVLELYFNFQLSPLRLGFDCHSLIHRIDLLRKKSVVLNNSLNDLTKNRLLKMKTFFTNSFRKYRERIRTHPDYISLSMEEQRVVMERLYELERNFMES